MRVVMNVNDKTMKKINSIVNKYKYTTKTNITQTYVILTLVDYMLTALSDDEIVSLLKTWEVSK